MRISLVGLPGAGKSTLASILGSMFNTFNISSGEIARAHGFAGSTAEKTGQLDPDENKIRTLVKQALGDADKYILDGFPRMIDQIDEVQIPLDAVIYLYLPNQVVGVERLLMRGRPDDNLETIGARIATYWRYTHPLVDHFDKKGMLIDIDASGMIAETVGKAVVQLGKHGLIEAQDYIYDLLKKDIYGTGQEKEDSSKQPRATSPNKKDKRGR